MQFDYPVLQIHFTTNIQAMSGLLYFFITKFFLFITSQSLGATCGEPCVQVHLPILLSFLDLYLMLIDGFHILYERGIT